MGLDCQSHSGMEAVVEAVENGLCGATEIGAELGISKGQVSKLAQKAVDAGLLKKVKGRYYAAQSKEFPELPQGVL